MPFRTALAFLCLLFVLTVSRESSAEDSVATPSAEAEAFFEKTVRPILVARCWECHGERKQEGSIRLDSHEAIFKQGDSGEPTIIAGEPDKSLLMRVVGYADDTQMPPKGKLPDEEIAALQKWILQGAVFPASAAATGPALGAMATPEGIQQSRATHWAYQPVKDFPIPDVRHANWARNWIDRYLLEKLELHQISPALPVDRRTLLRRMSFDLVGMPPTFEEISEFERSAAPDADVRELDRLLASPHYGERWGRHWLDIARYADTKGYVFTEERKYPFSYTYRDYVIQAFNDDLPFDEFVREQLAADQLPDVDKSALAAMGFLTLGRRFGNNPHDIIDDRIDVVSRGLLGLTVTCARCHDHKYDAIPTDDYYSLYGIFASSVEPAELPQLGEPHDIDAYQKYERELQKRKSDVQAYVTSCEAVVRDQLRSQSHDYLWAVLDSEEAKTESGKKRLDALKPMLIQRWKTYLAEVTKEPHPVFGAWQKLLQLPADQFSEQASAVIAELQDSPEAQSRTNSAVKQALQSAQPASREAVAEVYGKLLEEVQQEWVKLRETGAMALPDSQREELRQVLYSDKGPYALNDKEAKQFFDRAQKNKIRDLERKVESFQATSPAAPPRAMVMVDAEKPTNPHVFVRGNPGRPGKEVPRQFFQVLQAEPKPFQKGSGRLELAEAIVSPQNPLTPRVMVNRLWQHHFGQGLVRTPSDFGVRGELPTHPELLDALAISFLDHRWSLKQLHREMMSTAAYQQSSADRPECREIDPDNHLLGKMNRRRLEFEPYRDSLLAVAGQFDDSMTGRTVDLFKAPYAHRRAVYGFIDRQDLPGTFRVFDFASPDVSTAQRAETTIPQQLLFGMNSPFVIEQAHALVQSLATMPENAAEQKIQQIYHQVYARSASPEELTSLMQFLHEVETMPISEPVIWQYGYGYFDEGQQRVAEFTPLPHFQDQHWRGGPQIPAPQLGWVDLAADSGHPGGTPHLAVIRRWIAPHTGIVEISGVLEHPADQGDGVRGRIVSSRTGLLAEQKAFHGKSPLTAQKVAVEAGDTIDFIVDCLTQESHDSFHWGPEIRMEGTPNQLWSAKNDFHGPRNWQPPMEQLVQALLLSNEFVFVD